MSVLCVSMCICVSAVMCRVCGHVYLHMHMHECLQVCVSCVCACVACIWCVLCVSACVCCPCAMCVGMCLCVVRVGMGMYTCARMHLWACVRCGWSFLETLAVRSRIRDRRLCGLEGRGWRVLRGWGLQGCRGRGHHGKSRRMACLWLTRERSNALSKQRGDKRVCGHCSQRSRR